MKLSRWSALTRSLSTVVGVLAGAWLPWPWNAVVMVALTYSLCVICGLLYGHLWPNPPS